MTLSEFFLILAIVFYLVGAIPYAYHIFHGRVVPHPFSWTVWFLFSVVNGYIIFESYGYSSLIILMIIRSLALGAGAITGWVYISKISIGKMDIIALILAISMIFVLKYFGLNEAIVSMIIIDLLVLFPTLKKIWIEPRSEDALIWLTSTASFICFILALPNLNFANSGYWIYGITANALVALLIYRRTLYLSNWKNILKKYIEYFALKKKQW